MLRTLQLFPSLLLLTVASLAVSVPARADFVAAGPLLGDNEVPNPVITAAEGYAIVQYSVADNALAYEVVLFSDLATPATGAHIHFGADGTNGPILLEFNLGPLGTIENLVGVLCDSDITAAAIGFGLNNISLIAAQIEAGNTYVNIHSEQYPAGEIRGQLSADREGAIPEPSSVALVGLGLLGTLVLKRHRN